MLFVHRAELSSARELSVACRSSIMSWKCFVNATRRRWPLSRENVRVFRGFVRLLAVKSNVRSVQLKVYLNGVATRTYTCSWRSIRKRCTVRGVRLLETRTTITKWEIAFNWRETTCVRPLAEIRAYLVALFKLLISTLYYTNLTCYIELAKG